MVGWLLGGWIDGWMDGGWVDGWMVDGWMDKYMDGWSLHIFCLNVVCTITMHNIILMYQCSYIHFHL